MRNDQRWYGVDGESVDQLIELVEEAEAERDSLRQLVRELWEWRERQDRYIDPELERRAEAVARAAGWRAEVEK